MNFLAHFLIATQTLPLRPNSGELYGKKSVGALLAAPSPPNPAPQNWGGGAFSAYVLGTALPDLLPLAADRVRLRPAQVEAAEAGTEFEAALAVGVSVHLATDAAFHKTAAFASAQAEVGGLLADAGFEGMRVRRFFVAHVLTELVLDAALLRAGPELADRFYGAFTAADFDGATRWAEGVTGRTLPHLPRVLTRFAASQYLRHYAEDGGVATGLSNLCRRAGQDTFEGENFARLVRVVGQATAQMPAHIPALFSETAAGIRESNGETGLYLNEARMRT